MCNNRGNSKGGREEERKPHFLSPNPRGRASIFLVSLSLSLSLSLSSLCQSAFRFQNESECNGRKPKLWPFSAPRRLCVRDNGSRPDPFTIQGSRRAGGQGVFAMFRRYPGTQLQIECVEPHWRGTCARVSRREILARSRGLSENRYDSFSFGAPLPLPARAACGA